jgi:hypothetical protein
MVLGVASCIDLGPRQHTLAYLSDIEVPASVAASDSLHVSFRYTHGVCDSDIRAEVQASPGARTFFVSIRRPYTGQAQCTDQAVIKQFSYAVPPSLRTTQFTVKFVLPEGLDSIRVVTWQ